ncbi:hypothetical protein [Chitinilyticum litopenaei]|uniref:hypothetical protein n=1 Tax=Chitinilyticum litopenaei TaxID=1121276 RepID=UPI0004278C55|nr:hypothetical protein [Chitinilyticum litopenaei]
MAKQGKAHRQGQPLPDRHNGGSRTQVRWPLFFCVLALSGTLGAAVPSHFGDQMEAQLSCRSEWSPDYWRNYFRQYLGQPLRVWGEAEWFDAQKAELAGNTTLEVWAEVPESGVRMVGALLKGRLVDVKANIEERLGYGFVALPGPYPRYLSKFGSVLVPVVGTNEEQVKWYCARWHLGNRP